MPPQVVEGGEMGRLNELEAEICLHVDSDEQWSYVQKQRKQRWLWYIRERFGGRILAYRPGKRTDETFRELHAGIRGTPAHQVLPHRRLGAYYRELPLWQVHSTDKADMQRIKRQKLNFRTHIKGL